MREMQEAGIMKLVLMVTGTILLIVGAITMFCMIWFNNVSGLLTALFAGSSYFGFYSFYVLWMIKHLESEIDKIRRLEI